LFSKPVQAVGSLVALTDGFAVGGYDGLLLRTDPYGDTQWKAYVGGPGNSIAGIVAMPSGFAVAGTASTKGAGAEDFWLARSDGKGTTLWEKTFGGTANDHGFALAGTPDGFVIAGYTTSKGAGNQDAWLVRTDADGNKLWDATYGSSADDQATALLSVQDGFVFTGFTGAIVPNNHAWLVRVGPTGQTIWDKKYPAGGGSYAYALAGLADGFVVAGVVAVLGAGDINLRVIRTDASGNALWDRSYGGTSLDWAWSIASVSDGLAIAGQTASKGAGSADAWLMKTDLAGNLLWDRTYGTAAFEAARAIQALPDGFVMSAGDKGALLRTDVFGNTTCPDSGACAGKKIADCDDKNPCTADLCDALSGCSHAALVDGAGCGGSSVCVSGTCQAVPAGMAFIPAGTFKMGCVPGDGKCSYDEKPQHNVTLDAYYMDVDLVTAAKYKACVDAGKCTAPTACSAWYQTYGTAGKEVHPVNCVTWFQADAYCKGAAAYGGKGVLPTEAQWERAARGGIVDAIYPWGNDAPTCVAGQKNTACFSGSGGGCGTVSTCPVTFSGANGYGLRDMAGNVWECTSDWYVGSYPSSDATNPTGPVSGSYRVIRGGYFDYGASYLRASQRMGILPSDVDRNTGFRCARAYP